MPILWSCAFLYRGSWTLRVKKKKAFYERSCGQWAWRTDGREDVEFRPCSSTSSLPTPRPSLSFFMCNNKTLRIRLLTHATMCTVLSERGQTQKATYCLIPFIQFFGKKKSATVSSENRSIAIWDRGWGQGINHTGAPGNFGMIELLSILIFDISWAKVLTTSKKGEFHWM